MNGNEKDAVFLRHILDEIGKIEKSTRGMTPEGFRKNQDIQDAVIRRIEVIGEAAKNVSAETRAEYPKVEWKKIAGTRAVLIHAHFSVDLGLTWKIITDHLPALKSQIGKILSDIGKTKKSVPKNSRKGAARLAVVLAVFASLAAPAFAQTTNVSALYGYNGTTFIPVRVTATGTLMTDLNISESLGLSPLDNNTYDIGDVAKIWANAYIRTIRSMGPALSFVAGGSERMTITAGGLVGIGITSPQQTFEVVGTLNATGRIFLNGSTWIRGIAYTWPSADGSSGNVLTTNGAGVLSWAAAATGSNLTGGGATNRIAKWQNTTHLTNSQLFDDGTFVGIGTTSPNATLDVRGNIQIQGNITPYYRPSFFNKTPDANGAFSVIANGTDNLSVIVYQGADNKQKVIKCANHDCISTNNTITDMPGEAGHSPFSIAIGTDTFPVIAMQRYQALEFIKCGNILCSSGNTNRTLATYGGNDQFSVAITVPSDGKPIVAFGDSNTYDLRIIKCDNSSCSTSTQYLLDGNGSAGYMGPTSIAIGTDGYPVIAYHTHGGNFSIFKCGHANCTSGNTIAAIDPGQSISTNDARGSSIAIGSDGFPIAAYRNSSDDDLVVIKCGNAGCTSGNYNRTIIDSSGDVGAFPVIKIGFDKKPIISYYDGTNADLKVVKCGDLSCSNGNIITRMDSTGSVGADASIVVMNDTFPMISYKDSTSGKLKVIKCSDANCTDTGVAATYAGGTDIGNTTQYSNRIYSTSVFSKVTTVASYDLAEEYEMDEDTGVGDIVCASGFKRVTRCDSIHTSIVGAVSEKPGITLGEWEGQKPANVRPVALVGRTRVKVSDENGAVAVGDYIAVSSKPGVGMKAAGGKTVGIALENYNGRGIGSILVAVKAGESLSGVVQKQQSVIDELKSRLAAVEEKVEQKVK